MNSGPQLRMVHSVKCSRYAIITVKRENSNIREIPLMSVPFQNLKTLFQPLVSLKIVNCALF